MSFKNKSVLITGGSAGIGAATAVLFAKEGASLAIVGRNEARLKIVSEKCQEHGVTPFVIIADVSRDEAASEIINKTIEKYGKLDVLINNAGILFSGGLLDGDIMKNYDKIMNTNLRAIVNLTNLAVPYLVKSRGNIINVSSVLGQIANPMMLVYGVSKAALDHFSKNAALELGPSGVRVNIVSPGPVATDILTTACMPHSWEELGKQAPLGKVGYPDEVADVILFLASDKAKSITGSNYTMDNGASLYSRR